MIDDDDEWHIYALCAQTDPEIFFPEAGVGVNIAKAVCNRCAVRERCLEVALKREEKYGVWGGKSEYQRRMILRQRRRDERRKNERDWR